MNTELKQTLQFVFFIATPLFFFIATPLCLVNSFITSDKFNLWNDWGLKFLTSYAISFPQAVLYVSLVKWYKRRKCKINKQILK